MIKNKQGQMEMIGLVVIVILITLGMLFMAQFALKEDPAKKVFTRKGLAYSTLSALMKTSAYNEDCVNEYSGIREVPQLGKKILEDCALNYATKEPGLNACGASCIFSCREKHSCVFLEEFIAETLEETLGKWGKSYELRSVVLVPGTDFPPELILIKNKGGCPKTKERDSSGSFPIHTPMGLVESELYICD